MKNLKVGDKVEVEIVTIKKGKDDRIYVTVVHPDAWNRPSFILRNE